MTNKLNLKKIKTCIFYLALMFSVSMMYSCKKDIDGNDGTNEEVDMSGSILDKNIDQDWTSPDGTMKLNFKIVTTRTQSVGNTKTIYKVDLITKLVSGKYKPIQVKLKFRHFPQNYTEYDEVAKKTVPISEAAHASYTFNTLNPSVNIYEHIPDPGPIDKLEFSVL